MAARSGGQTRHPNTSPSTAHLGPFPSVRGDKFRPVSLTPYTRRRAARVTPTAVPSCSRLPVRFRRGSGLRNARLFGHIDKALPGPASCCTCSDPREFRIFCSLSCLARHAPRRGRARADALTTLLCLTANLLQGTENLPVPSAVRGTLNSPPYCR